MRWLLMASIVAALAWGCRGEEGLDAQALVEAAFDAIIAPGMVFHARGDDGTEVWIDGERELFRDQSGEEGDLAFVIAVGEGWSRTGYDGWENRVKTYDVRPDGVADLRVDHPVAGWFGPLTAIAYAPELRVVGERESAGHEVIVLEARSPLGGEDYPEGSTFLTRAELDRGSHLVVAYETQVVVPEEKRDEYEGEERVDRVVYEISEFIPREELPEGFFSPQDVYEAVVTFEERLGQVRSLGIEPYWLGERLEAAEGDLAVSGVWDINLAVQGPAEASLHYSLVTPQYGESGDTVVISLRPAGSAAFEPAQVPPVGPRPEREERVTVQGQEAILYTSELRPEAVPCAVGLPCEIPDVPLYHRLVVTLDGTAIQVETFAKARPDLGVDENPFNNRQSVLAFAEALRPAE